MTMGEETTPQVEEIKIKLEEMALQVEESKPQVEETKPKKTEEEKLKIDELHAKKLRLLAEVKVLKAKHEHHKEVNKLRLENLKKIQESLQILKKQKQQQLLDLQQI